MDWVQPKILSRYHELRSGESVFATLKWVKSLGSLAEATTSDGRFTLKRGGFVRPYISVRDVAYDNDVAILRIGLVGHGSLELSNGRRITLLSTRFWSYNWELSTESGQVLCSIKQKAKVATNSAEVTISDGVRRDRDLMIIIVACWYAMVLMSDEAAAVAGSAASSPALMAAGVFH